MNPPARALMRLFLFLFSVASAGADGESFTVAFASGDKVRTTEKANLRRYESDRFIGLAYREVRGVLEVGDSVLSGRYYVSEETRHDASLVAKRIEGVYPARFSVQSNGEYLVTEDQAYPVLRSFPVFPEGALEAGDKWEAFGARVVEPFRDGRFTRVKFYCGYEYTGTEMREGREYRVIKAQYAMRYKEGQDPYGDDRIKGISGSHVVKIYFDVRKNRPSFMHDTMHETYTLEDGGSVAYKGFILTWFEGIDLMDRTALAEEITRELADVLGEEAVSLGEEGASSGSDGTHGEGTSGAEGAAEITVRETEEGVSLTLGGIHFVPDQAVVLPEEVPRLKAVADALRSVAGRTFLVIGHTADVGSTESQRNLSVERAKNIVDFLVSEGIDPRRLLYEGRGGTEPVATNATDEGRAKNRRVEILIIED